MNDIELKKISDISKRDYFTKRFSKFRKDNKLNPNLTPYSFRHYYITKLYNILRKSNDLEDTIKELSLITGHTSKAIWNYIHTNDLELPEDYSNMLK